MQDEGHFIKGAGAFHRQPGEDKGDPPAGKGSQGFAKGGGPFHAPDIVTAGGQTGIGPVVVIRTGGHHQEVVGHAAFLADHFFLFEVDIDGFIMDKFDPFFRQDREAAIEGLRFSGPRDHPDQPRIVVLFLPAVDDGHPVFPGQEAPEPGGGCQAAHPAAQNNNIFHLYPSWICHWFCFLTNCRRPLLPASCLVYH